MNDEKSKLDRAKEATKDEHLDEKLQAPKDRDAEPSSKKVDGDEEKADKFAEAARKAKA